MATAAIDDLILKIESLLKLTADRSVFTAEEIQDTMLDLYTQVTTLDSEQEIQQTNYMRSILEEAKEPFLNGGVNDLAVFLGDLTAMVTIAYYIKMDYLGFGFWFGWAFNWIL